MLPCREGISHGPAQPPATLIPIKALASSCRAPAHKHENPRRVRLQVLPPKKPPSASAAYTSLIGEATAAPPDIGVLGAVLHSSTSVQGSRVSSKPKSELHPCCSAGQSTDHTPRADSLGWALRKARGALAHAFSTNQPTAPAKPITEPCLKAFTKPPACLQDSCCHTQPRLKTQGEPFPELMRLSCFDPGHFSTDTE